MLLHQNRSCKSTLREKIVSVLGPAGVRDEFRRLGLRLVGNEPNGSGWIEAHAAGRPDVRPSAGINVSSAHYYDHGSGESLSLIDFAAQYGPFPDAESACRHYASMVGGRSEADPTEYTRQPIRAHLSAADLLNIEAAWTEQIPWHRWTRDGGDERGTERYLRIIRRDEAGDVHEIGPVPVDDLRRGGPDWKRLRKQNYRDHDRAIARGDDAWASALADRGLRLGGAAYHQHDDPVRKDHSAEMSRDWIRHTLGRRAASLIEAGTPVETVCGAVLQLAEETDREIERGRQHYPDCTCTACKPDQIIGYSEQVAKCCKPAVIAKANLTACRLRRVAIPCKRAGCGCCHQNHLLQRGKEHCINLFTIVATDPGRIGASGTIWKVRSAPMDKQERNTVLQRLRRNGASGWIRTKDADGETWYSDVRPDDGPWEQVTLAEAIRSACGDIDRTEIGQRHLYCGRPWGYAAVEKLIGTAEAEPDEEEVYLGETVCRPEAEKRFAKKHGLRLTSESSVGMTFDFPRTWGHFEIDDYFRSLKAAIAKDDYDAESDSFGNFDIVCHAASSGFRVVPRRGMTNSTGPPGS